MSNRPRSLEPEQAAAATCLDRNVFLSAGAGCGKTSTLVERYTNILKDRGAQVSDIVAITFTEKAANELKTRIRERVMELSDGAADPAARATWREHLFAVESAQIGTIHGFCSAILREFPVEARLDPNFAVADEVEAASMVETAVRDALFAAVESGDEAALRLLDRYEYATLAALLEDAMGDREGLSVARETLGLASAGVEEVAREMRRRAEAFARDAAAGFLTSGDFEKAAATLGAAQGPDGDKIEKMRADFLAAHAAWRAAGPPGRDLLGAARAMRDSIGALRGGSAVKWGGKECLAEVKSALTAARKVLDDALEMAEGVEEEDWPARASEAIDFHSLYAVALARLAELKRRRGIVDFDDMLIMARDLVRSEPRVAAALCERYRFLLVDEFQDTDHVQAELVERIAGGVRPANLFLVGDPMQSIYSFRGAEVEVFRKVEEAYSRERLCEVMNLILNHRTLPHILSFVNALFGRMMPAGAAAAVAYRPLVPKRKSAHRRVEFILAASSTSTCDARRIEAQTLARRINEMVAVGAELVAERDADGERFRRPGYGDIAILFSAMTSAYIYERELEKAGVPFYTVAGSTFYLRQEVKDLLNILRFVVDPEDSLSLVGALRSPLFAVSDDYLATLAHGSRLPGYFSGRVLPGGGEADMAAMKRAVDLVADLRRLKGRLPVRRMLDMIFDATGFVSAVAATYDGSQKVANVMKVREEAAAFDAWGHLSLEDFVAHVSDREQKQARESQAPLEDTKSGAVRLMTVHAAKGLEFAVVILADAGRRRNISSGGRAVSVDRELGICLPGAADEERPYLSLMKRVEARREEAEDKRVFFVAATRARDHLIVSGAMAGKKGVPPTHPDGWAKYIVDALEIDVNSPGDYDFEGFTVEYSSPSAYENLSRSWKSPLLEWRSVLASGGAIPAAAHPDAERLLEQVRPLAPARPGRARFTATAIADYLRCPLHYELMFVRGLPPDSVLLDREEAQSRELPGFLVGTVLHDTISAVRPRERLLAALDRVIKADDSYQPVAARLRAACEPVLARLEASDFYRRIRAAGRGRSEMPFAFTIGEYLIEGRIDLALAGEIIDFKSDAVSAQEVPLHAENYRAQMDIYALAHARVTGAAPERMTLYFLAPGMELTWPYGPEGLDEAVARVAATLDSMLSGARPQARPDDSCVCEYRELCRVLSAAR